MDKLVCVQDFEKEALNTLGKLAADYYKSGSDYEVTLQKNTQAYNSWLIRPRMLRDVSVRNLKKVVQGKTVNIPIGFAPTGFLSPAHPDGEIASARSANAHGTIFVLSTYATRSIEEIADACPGGRNWFQLYPNSSPDISKDMVQRAERAGFEAIVVTADAQKFGKKWNIVRNGQFIPPHVRLGNFEKYITAEQNSALTKSHTTGTNGSSPNEHVKNWNTHAEDLSWDIIKFVKGATKLPVIVKGILRAEDAELAVKHGADGVWISNHGGRQVDTVPHPIDILPDISRAVKGKCEIYIDSGIIRGSDVFKALALGATMAFVGRPQIWGISVNGEKGATKVLGILREELDMTMALSGVADVNAVTEEYVCKYDALSNL